MYMSGAMNHCVWLTMSQPWQGTTSAGVSGNSETCTQGLAHARIALCQRYSADTEETGRYDLAWKDLCSVLNALSK